MPTIYHKSVHLIILNATMVARSLGRSIQSRRRRRSTLKKYKQLVFKKFFSLATKMQRRTLETDDIHGAISQIASELNVSFGQAQKGINVLLKYQYHIHHSNSRIGSVLDCPLDSKILDSLNEHISLARMTEEQYTKIQEKIAARSRRRIDYDHRWDEQHLADEGLL